MKVKATLKQIAKNLTFLFYSFKALNDSPEISDQKIKIKEYAKLKIINPM
jgi:hypothetical protein